MVRKILLLTDGILLFLSFLIGIDYAYYIANIKYVNNTQTVILSDVLNLKDDDNHDIIISNENPGYNFEKNFAVENVSDKDTTFNILFTNILNEYENDLVYELYENENLIVSQTVAPKTSENSYVKLRINLAKATTNNYKLKFSLLNRNAKNEIEFQNKKFNAKIAINSLEINSEIKTATNYILINNNIIEDTNILDGLFKTVETNSGKESYYYKGNVENNYVLFNQELWRIIRINEDGSIRIIKNENIGTNVQFNTDSKQDNSYDYFSSNIKNELDNYYNQNLLNYDSMIIEQNYCNTLNVVKNDNYKISENNMSYQNYIPTLKCSEDKKLKIGLITYDEASLAGITYGIKNNNYLVNGNNINTWTISKAGLNSYNKDNYIWRISQNGALNETVVSSQHNSVRPVINLKGTLNVTGVGTLDNPYIFKN